MVCAMRTVTTLILVAGDSTSFERVDEGFS
jgi:hypothetical protein